MKKISIGIALLFSLLPTLGSAANVSTAKNDGSIPCYNGGFNFGLAGYEVTKSNNQTANQNSQANVDSKTQQNSSVGL